MTQRNDDTRGDPTPTPGAAVRPLADGALERIAAELAALGEDPADDDELDFASHVHAEAMEHEPHEPHDVRTVATLVALSRWQAPSEGLRPLERHRVWQRVAARLPSLGMGTVADPEERSANDADAGGWRGVVASLALVAGVILMLHVDVAPPPSADDRAALRSLGEATRATLEGTLPGEQDGARARTLAEGYAERLQQATRGDEP